MRGRIGVIALVLSALIVGISLSLSASRGSPAVSDAGDQGSGNEVAARATLYGPVSYHGSASPLVMATKQRQALPVLGLNNWTELGPNPSSGRSSTVPGYTVTGRVNALAYDTRKSHLYLASEGGVWSRYLGGSSSGWAPLTDDMPSPIISSLAVDPQHGDVVYAGTGEQAQEAYNNSGVGIYKSTDGGLRWTPYGSGLFSNYAILALAVDPTRSNYVYAGYSSPIGKYGGSQGGVAVSKDAGVTWNRVTSGNSSVSDLQTDASGNLYVALSQKGRATRVFYCARPADDICKQFVPASHGLPGASAGRVQLALDPHTVGLPRNQQVLYAAMTDAGTGAHNDQLLGVYRTADGGANWTQVAGWAAMPQAHPETHQAHYDLTLAVDPSDLTGNTVYVGMQDLYKTTNASSPSSLWTRLTDYDHPNGIHVDQHVLLFVGNSLYIGNDGGLYMTANGGAAFSSFNQNLRITQFYRGAVGTTQPSLVVGGTQDNGVQLSTGAGWKEVYTGDEFGTQIDPTDNDVIYSEYIGAQTVAIIQGRTNVTNTFNGNADGALADAPLLMHPTNNAELLSGRKHVWVSTDNESTWTEQSSPTTEGITALSVPRNPDTRIYIADIAGHAWRRDDATVTQLSGPTLPDGRWITSFATDPANANIVYATANGTNGAQSGHIFRSADAGLTWKDISKSLPDTDYYSVATSPLIYGTLYVGAENGVYVSRDSGASWYQLGTGLPNIPVRQLALNPGGTELTAFTFGRGAWRYSLATGYGLAWGYYGTGQLDDGRSADTNNCGALPDKCWQGTPTQMPDVSDVVVLAGGAWDGTLRDHSLALKKDGTVLAWGANESGQAGTGTVSPGTWTNNDGECQCVKTPTPVVDSQKNRLTGIIAIAAKGNGSYALKNDGTVWAWGGNASGELGNGSVSTTGCDCVPYAVQVPGLTGVVAITTGSTSGYYGGFAAALKSDGTVVSWGYNKEGELGTGAVTTSANDTYHCYCVPHPVAVINLQGVASISANGSAFGGRVLALRNDGTVWGWGENFGCALTNIASCENAVPTPTQLAGLSSITQVVAGGNASYALKKNGTVLAWGFNAHGELGRGTIDPFGAPGCSCQPQPAPVIGGQDAVAIATGPYVVALQRDGSVMWWGSGSATPSTFTGLSFIRGIWASDGHFLALK